MVRPPAPLWSNREFLDNFCAGSVIFVLRLNCKIRVPRLLSCINCVKCTQSYHFGDNFFSGERPRPLHHTPHLSTPTAPRSRLAEILNTPLTILYHTREPTRSQRHGERTFRIFRHFRGHVSAHTYCTCRGTLTMELSYNQKDRPL